MGKYVKKQIEVEAFQVGVDYIPDWAMENIANNNIVMHKEDNIMSADVVTLEGTMKANHGDYIIQGVNKEVYPCKEDIFKKTYNLVDDEVTELMKLRNLFTEAILNDSKVIIYMAFENKFIETNIYYSNLGEILDDFETGFNSNLELEGMEIKVVEAVAVKDLSEWFSKDNQELISNRIFGKTGIRI